MSIGQCTAFIANGWNGAKASKYGKSGSEMIIIVYKIFYKSHNNNHIYIWRIMYCNIL